MPLCLPVVLMRRCNNVSLRNFVELRASALQSPPPNGLAYLLSHIKLGTGRHHSMFSIAGLMSLMPYNCWGMLGMHGKLIHSYIC